MRRILPSVALYVALVAATILLDRLLHAAGLQWVGRYLGAVGTAAILASFAYSLRKREWIRAGSPKELLRWHELLAWAGALLVSIHAGIHFNALIPWLAVAAMLVVVASGLTGRYLLQQARVALREREAELRQKELPSEEIERELLGLSLLVGRMQKWRKVHMPLTAAFAGLAVVHVASTILLSSWR